ncbi:MAG: molybdopterin-dependent oxidoreductase [Jatrophihabitantaceae bacterium]
MRFRQDPPAAWPRFASTLRSTAVTARLGRVLGICIAMCFVTGLLSHYQYSPWRWLPEPASPVWLYRVTQGVHVATGTAAIPLLLVKLWSVYPNLFRWPPARSALHGLERASVAVLVSTTFLQLVTGFFNMLAWYPWQWSFVPVHYALAFVVIGSVLLHVAIKLPDIRYGLKARVADADVLTEIPWSENPLAHSKAGPQPAPPTPGLTRRGLLAATGAGIGVVIVTTVGQSIPPLAPLGLLAGRDPRNGPQGVPVTRTADQARVRAAATAPDWTLHVSGPSPYTIGLADLEALADTEADLPISCVEGWSVGARWRGLRLLDVVRRAGGNADSRVEFASLEARSPYTHSHVEGPQLAHALLATHLNGHRLDIHHGYPLRLIAPDRAGVLNTKWLARIEVR